MNFRQGAGEHGTEADRRDARHHHPDGNPQGSNRFNRRQLFREFLPEVDADRVWGEDEDFFNLAAIELPLGGIHDSGDGLVAALGWPPDAAEVADGWRKRGDAAEGLVGFRVTHDCFFLL